MKGRTLTHAPSVGASEPLSKELEVNTRDGTDLRPVKKCQLNSMCYPTGTKQDPVHFNRAGGPLKGTRYLTHRGKRHRLLREGTWSQLKWFSKRDK